MRKSNGTKGKTWIVQQLQCAYCGKPFGVATLRRHSEKCFDNPEYVARLRQDIPEGILQADYDRVSSQLGLPNRARLRANFGSFQKFMRWLHEVNDVADVIGAELAENRMTLRSGDDGLPVLKAYQNKRGETCYVLR